MSDEAIAILEVAGSLDALNTTALLGIEMAFLMILASLAYWRKNNLLYFLSGLVSFSIALMWLSERQQQYMLILGISAIGLGFATILTPLISYFKNRE